jgi:5-(carboxyamino)imidazole ribonucleotide mutase
MAGKSKKSAQKTAKIKVAIVMGSESDLPFMEQASSALDQFKIDHDIAVISAHRTPDETAEFAKSARREGYRVIIAGAGGAAHLPGLIASHTELPVIGVPVPIGPLQGEDALLSIVQMPKGIPVATMAIGNSWNAGVLAAQILGAGLGSESGEALLNRIQDYKEEMRKKVLSKKIKTRPGR